ncbi:MAG: hypothetical protein AB7I59_04345 [Geminicoccaceae bacterium]
MNPEQRFAAALHAVPTVRFWWRDDDAGGDDDRLLPLLHLAAVRRAPLALAVVPAWLTAGTTRQILSAPSATVLQHGIAHADHSLPPAKKIELGGAADAAALLTELRLARERLAAAFGDRFVPVLVPPWNRIAPALLPGLPETGFTGISTFGPRAPDTPPGITRVNTHLDLTLWRENARPLPLADALDGLAGLVERRGDEPIGILSHHQVMDAGAFATLDHILALVQAHPGARLATARELFGEGG